MTEPPAKLWLRQVDSDLLCAQRVWDLADQRTYCQVMAKYQQAVEKSVKAIIASLKEVGIGLPAIGYAHDLSRHLEALERLPKSKDSHDLQMLVDAVLTRSHRRQIEAICQLAPGGKPRVAGELHRLNTEYPYETSVGVWAAPAAAGTFDPAQVQRFKVLAYYLYERACRLVGALRI